MSKRGALDQHEILDYLYTDESDKRAKKLARQQAKAAAKHNHRQPTREKRRPRPALFVATIAVSVLAPVGVTVWFMTGGAPLDPDRAACDEFSSFTSPAATTSPAEALRSAEGLAALSRTEMDAALAVKIESAANGARYLHRALDDEAAAEAIQGARSYANLGYQAVASVCDQIT